jgi:hypothetical protein
LRQSKTRFDTNTSRLICPYLLELLSGLMGGQGNRLLLTGKTLGSVEGSRTAARGWRLQD